MTRALGKNELLLYHNNNKKSKNEEKLKSFGFFLLFYYHMFDALLYKWLSIYSYLTPFHSSTCPIFFSDLLMKNRLLHILYKKKQFSMKSAYFDLQVSMLWRYLLAKKDKVIKLSASQTKVQRRFEDNKV